MQKKIKFKITPDPELQEIINKKLEKKRRRRRIRMKASCELNIYYEELDFPELNLPEVFVDSEDDCSSSEKGSNDDGSSSEETGSDDDDGDANQVKVEGDCHSGHEPNAAQELHADDKLNSPEGVGNAEGNDHVNAPAEIGREDDEQDGNQEKAVVDDEPKGTEDLDHGDSKDDKPGLSEDGNPIGSTTEPLPTSSNELENAPQTQADDEPKDTEDLDPPNAEELRKRKVKGIYHSDSDDDKSKDDKPDDNLSDDETLKEYKEEIYDRPQELIDGFDAGIPIETQKLPARSDELENLRRRSYGGVEAGSSSSAMEGQDNLYYTDEEYERQTQQAKHQSLLELEHCRPSSQSGSGFSSSAMEGISDFFIKKGMQRG